MFNNFSLKEQFKILLFPIMFLSGLTIAYISYNQYTETIKIENLQRTVELVEEVKKIINLIDKERFSSINITSFQDNPRMLRSFARDRKINDVRLRALQAKMDLMKQEHINDSFVDNLQTAINYFESKKFKLRKNIDTKKYSRTEVISEYTAINSNFINAITHSLDTIENVTLAQNIFAYALYLNYSDFFSVENVILEHYTKSNNSFETQNMFVQFSNFRNQINFIKRLATGIVSKTMIEHYIRIISDDNFSKMIFIKETIATTPIEEVNNISFDEMHKVNVRDFAYMSSISDRKIKELGDYISREINISIKTIVDHHYKKLFTLIVVVAGMLIFILFVTYKFYNFLQDTIFYSILKMKTKVVKTIKDRNISTFSHKNEINYLIHLIDGFAESVKTFVIGTKRDFKEIEGLSTKFSQSSERMVNHLYKQIQYIEEINFKLKLFFDLLNNNTKGFENLKDILNNTLVKINNTSLDVIYVSYETLNLQDMNQKVLDDIRSEAETTKNFLRMIVDLGKNRANGSDDIVITNLNYKTILDFIKDVSKRYDQQIEVFNSNVEKLRNLSQTTMTIKNESESNNNNLEDMLALITTIYNETLTIREEVSETIEESKSFTKNRKDIIKNGEYVYSDISLLYRFTVNLNMKFNKFRV